MNEQELEQGVMPRNHDGVIFVGSNTQIKGLSICIFACSTKEGRDSVKLRGIGAGAINQMTKAYIIAKGRLNEKGVTATVDMVFKDVPGKEPEKFITAVEYHISFKTQ